FQWQPVPPEIPARAALALVAGVIEIAAGLALLASRAGLVLAAAVMASWVALHLPSVLRADAAVADWLGVAGPGSLVVALALVAAAPRDAGLRLGFALYGAAAVVFGASHLAYADFTASMVPPWLPARHALAVATGVAHALAGLAIATGFARRLAATCEALMMLG